ncbi:MAG: hypothetical protein FJY55_07930 [Betaproteobacteria bacterium]|nr:hypothetical protein [Betaproteobacteria bacterium]
MSHEPGRSCPISYRYEPRTLARAPDLHAETLLIAGGIYGNRHALVALHALAAEEPGGATVVCNGDFHWFDIDAAAFAEVNQLALAHPALRGNVETEIALPEDDAGCGCAYPGWVGDAEVARSNAILRQLAGIARGDDAATADLARLPMNLVAEVGGERVGIVHGDASSLSGWDCSQEVLRDAPERTARQIDEAGVRVLATSHTCLPVLAGFSLPLGRAVLANNGAAGMPNFAGTQFGIVTRVSVRPARERLYGTTAEGLFVDALALRYDQDAWLQAFERWWPQGSAAHLSYHRRIVAGPDYLPAQAMRA